MDLTPYTGNRRVSMLKQYVRTCVATALSLSTIAISPSTASLAAPGAVIRTEVTIASDTEAAAALTDPYGKVQSRGELLYTTHCISCHTTQMHWRNSRSATSWATLELQVRRWQGAASLGWSDNDIRDVTRYLNENIYRFEGTSNPASSFGLPAARSERGAYSAADWRVP